MSLVGIYKGCVSFLLKVIFFGGCRYQPTCSEYAATAISDRGVVGGTVLATRRLLRCHPWGGSGFDPVPVKRNNG